MTWNDYLKNTKGKNPRPLLMEALSFVKNKAYALDLGAGALNDVRQLIEEDFKQIDVVDSNPEILKISKGFPEDRVVFHITSFQNFNFKDSLYDLVNAQYALPFAGPSHIHKVLEQVYKSLKPGGIFVGNFFGPEDEWSTDPTIAFMTKNSLGEFFNSKLWNTLKFEEEHSTRPTASGTMKQWHIFNIIASKI